MLDKQEARSSRLLQPLLHLGISSWLFGIPRILCGQPDEIYNHPSFFGEINGNNDIHPGELG